MNRADYKKDIEYLLSLVPVWVNKKPEEGWMPSSYGTGEYKSDLEVYERVQEIRKKIEGMKLFEDKCPNCGNEDIEFGEHDYDSTHWGCHKCGACITVWGDDQYELTLDCIEKDELND